MIQIRFIAAAATGAAILAAVPAAAAVKIAKYSGTISEGFDTTGVFGAPNTDLAGFGWAATFTYDSSLGAVRDSGPSFDISYGGEFYGYPSGTPIISATVTINGVSKTVFGTYIGSVQTSTDPLVGHRADDTFADGIKDFYNNIYAYADPAGAPASLDQNFGPVAAFGSSGFTQWTTYDWQAGGYAEYAYAVFGPEMVYSVGNAVPEPASWAFMIAGLGLVGAAMRRGAVVAA